MADSSSGLSEDEAKEFHKFYIQGFLGFSAVALLAHFLVYYLFRTWPEGTVRHAENAQQLLNNVSGLLG